MDKDTPSIFDCIFNESVCKPEELFGVLFRVIMQVNIQILEVLLPLCVLLRGYIKYVSDSNFEQMFCLQPCNKIAIGQICQNLNRVKTLQHTITHTSTKWRMRKSATIYILLVLEILFYPYCFLVLIYICLLIKVVPCLVLLDIYACNLTESMSLRLTTS